MPYAYRPRGMPARFMVGATTAVKRAVLDILYNGPDAVLPYDVLFRPEPDADGIVGLDFGEGVLGCHFFLTRHEARAYRERNRRARVAWHDLPQAVRVTIINYIKG